MGGRRNPRPSTDANCKHRWRFCTVRFGSPAGTDASDRVELDIIHRVVGVGTDWLSRLMPGDQVSILGPLGNRFQLPPAEGRHSLWAAASEFRRCFTWLMPGPSGSQRDCILRALRRELLPLTFEPGQTVPGPDHAEPRPMIAEFARHRIDSVVSTDDGSIGFRGYVTQALEAYLDGRGFKFRPGWAGPLTSVDPLPIIYTCGPEPMMKRVRRLRHARVSSLRWRWNERWRAGWARARAA